MHVCTLRVCTSSLCFHGSLLRPETVWSLSSRHPGGYQCNSGNGVPLSKSRGQDNGASLQSSDDQTGLVQSERLEVNSYRYAGVPLMLNFTSVQQSLRSLERIWSTRM